MKRAAISGGAFTIGLVLFLLGQKHWAVEPDFGVMVTASPATTASTLSTQLVGQGFLFGRVTTYDGGRYEGRLRFGGDEEAFWGDYFNGVKADNPWATHAPPEQLTRERHPISLFGFELSFGERQIELSRPLMARFGDIARLEADGRDLRVTLKSGTVFPLDRFAADDFADGLRVWDHRRGIVDLDEWVIRSIELVPNATSDAAPNRLHGTVRTEGGDFTGFIQWDRKACVVSDELVGRTADGEVRLRFGTIRAVARRSRDSSVVTLLGGRSIVLTDTREGGHRGIYVDDRRYGRVLVSWDIFERVDMSVGGSGPAYTDFPPGHPLKGSVTTRAGLRLTGRLVYDLDESETTETLDAPSRGVDYTIPFGLIVSIVPAGRGKRVHQRASVTLDTGEELQLEPTGDLGDGNAGMLIFVDGRERPQYVQWADVEQVDLDRPPAMYPQTSGKSALGFSGQ